jgi:4-hydroxysphinganine ceramide fatty acyl 2-hydroxylase
MKRFIIYGVIVFGLIFYSTYYTITLGVCLAGILGVLTWMIAEYLFHRFAFHSSKSYPFLAYDHLNHHEHPEDKGDFVLPLRLTLPVSIALFFLAYFVLGFPAAAFFYTGMFVGYFFYELVHYQAHYKNWNLWPFNVLTRRHLQHHYENENKMFGVTSSLFDWVMGTE